jgi:hypothetical protein
MNHGAARLQIGADPHDVSGHLAEHLAGCAECSQFRHEMIALDNNIRRALEGPPGAAAPAAQTVISPATAQVTALTDARARAAATKANKRSRNTHAWRGWAVAASVALLALFTVWAFRPNESLAQDVVQHVTLESNSWTSDEHVTPEEMRETLAHAGVELDTTTNKVMYAHSCPFHGHIVPHLVVSTPNGRVTVLILRYESVRRRMKFREGGMSGVITPAPRGSIAVLMRGDENIDSISNEVRQSVHWLP